MVVLMFIRKTTEKNLWMFTVKKKKEEGKTE